MISTTKGRPAYIVIAVEGEAVPARDQDAERDRIRQLTRNALKAAGFDTSFGRDGQLLARAPERS